jgi:phospholipid transport system transporter-binding protein
MTQITQQENQWRISGDILMDNANIILGESHALTMNKVLEIDLSAVTNLDTAALSLMMELQRRALSENCQLLFANLPANLVSLAELYGVNEFIPLAKT